MTDTRLIAKAVKVTNKRLINARRVVTNSIKSQCNVPEKVPSVL